MKKTILGVAVLALALSSCSKESETVDQTPQAISFGEAAVGNNTRAQTETEGGIKSTFEEGDIFGVFGYYTSEGTYESTVDMPNFMYNQVVTRGTTAGIWSYAPLKYWPNDVNSANEAGRVSFFAYWPMANASNGITVESANNEAGDPIIGYDMAKPYDLMWGVNSTTGLPHLNLTKQATDDKVNFLFKHALSRVGFKIVLGGDIIDEAMNDAATTVTINSIEFGGTLATSIEDPLVGVLAKTADLNLNNTTANTPRWTNEDGTYLISLTTDDLTDGGMFKETAVAGTNVAFDGEITNLDTEYAMVIPIDLSAEDAKIRIVYTVETTDANLSGGKSTVVNKTVVDLATAFQGGKAYLYTFTIGLNTVKVTESIDPWADEENVDEDVPTA